MRVAYRLRQALTVSLLGLAVGLAGCTTIANKAKQTGANVGLRFAENHILAPVLTDDDVVMGCLAGQVFSPIIDAMGPHGMQGDNDQMSTLLYSTAAVCAEQEALENELRSLRATRQNHIEEAEDGRIMQKRWLEVAARRQYHAYQTFEHFYTSRGMNEVGGDCPTFRSDQDELVFMLGAISGLQAIVNDVNSQNQIGVPKDIGARVERAMTCLNNDKWWGLPKSVRAAIWNLIPGGGPEEPWSTMIKAMATGKQGGVRISYAIYAISAYAKGDDMRLRDAFRQYQVTLDDPGFVPSKRYKVFDKVGDVIMWGIADRYWSEHTGSRTPAGSIGHFWDEGTPPVDASIKLDDLL